MTLPSIACLERVPLASLVGAYWYTRPLPPLEPCAHCGGVAFLGRYPAEPQRYNVSEGDWRVGCERTDCPEIITPYPDEIPDAIAAWNRRTAAGRSAEVAVVQGTAAAPEPTPPSVSQVNSSLSLGTTKNEQEK